MAKKKKKKRAFGSGAGQKQIARFFGEKSGEVKPFGSSIKPGPKKPKSSLPPSFRTAAALAKIATKFFKNAATPGAAAKTKVISGSKAREFETGLRKKLKLPPKK